jgi:hypothetical protein
MQRPVKRGRAWSYCPALTMTSDWSKTALSALSTQETDIDAAVIAEKIIILRNSTDNSIVKNPLIYLIVILLLGNGALMSGKT